MGRRLVAASPFNRGYMSIFTVPVFIPSYTGGFTKVNTPVWEREFIGNYEHDTFHASFFARPDNQHTLVRFEVYDGQDFIPFGAVLVPTGMLLNANDSGYNQLFTVVKANAAHVINARGGQLWST